MLLPKDTDVLTALESDFLSNDTTPDHRLQILHHIDPTLRLRRSQSILLLEEKCQTVMRLLKSDLANLPIGTPSVSEEDTRDWLVQILTRLQAELKGQGSAELMKKITTVLKQHQP